MKLGAPFGSSIIGDQKPGGIGKNPSPFFFRSASVASSAFLAFSSSASIRALSPFVNNNSAGNRAPQKLHNGETRDTSGFPHDGHLYFMISFASTLKVRHAAQPRCL